MPIISRTDSSPQASAWRAYAANPGDGRARARLVDGMKRNPTTIDPAREADIRAMLDDPLVNPQDIAGAGWALLARAGRIPAPGAEGAAWLQQDDFALALLAATFVSVPSVELQLTTLRRWLLLSGRWPDYPATLAALTAQADHNGGSWYIDETEQAALDAAPNAPIVAAYFPQSCAPPAVPDYASPLTRRVAAHYVIRPYPAWDRLTVGVPTTLPAIVAALGPDAPTGLPVACDILIAGCGTGQEAAGWALRCPDARITAIDISPASLAYAESRCAAMGIVNIGFRRLDLHDIASLGMRFDAIVCSGVLHHLADPEAGWAALVEVLKPGGVMSLMVYSAYARLRIHHAQHLIADLRAMPLDETVLRAARARLIRDLPTITGSRDFYTLSGVHDLLFHEHEDPFDITRIVEGTARLGLDFLGFRLGAVRRGSYRSERPDDPYCRDIAAWRAIDREQPHPVRGQHNWWCAKPI